MKMKSQIHAIVFLAVSVLMLTSIATSSSVYAESCTAALSNPLIPTQYGNSNGSLVVPVSALCSTPYSQLYATGNAYDVTSNIALGSANTLLSPVNGGTQFNGQLAFTLLPPSPTDSLQVSVSIYNGQGGSLVTQTSETVQAGTEALQQPVQQTTTTTVTVGQYPYANPSPKGYQLPYQPNQSQYYGNQLQPPYQYQYQQGNQSYPSYYFSQGLPFRSRNQYVFEWVAIIAILAAVIITTVGLVLIAHRRPAPQPVWYPVPSPPR